MATAHLSLLAATLAFACSSAPAAPAGPTVLGTRVLQHENEMRLEEVTWTRGEEAGTAWLASWPDGVALRVAASEVVVPFADLLPTSGTWAAVNGGFYEDDVAMGLVVSRGRALSPLTARGGTGVVAAAPGGFHIFHRDAWAVGPSEALQSIDRLVDGGKNLVTARPDAPLSARAAIVRGGGRSWLVTLAGDRSIRWSPLGYRLAGTAGAGLSLHDFATFLLDVTRAEQALNLDGGVSTQMAVHGSRRFEVIGERGTINAVVLAPVP